MIKSLENIFKTKRVQRIQNNKQLQGGIILFVMFLSEIIISVVFYPSPQRVNNPLPVELQEIEKSIKEARNKTDPFVQERFIQQEARKLKLTSDEYKKLYALRKRDSEMLPDAPDSLIEQVKWFYQRLSREQRFKVIGIWGVRIIQGFSSLAILLGVGRFLWEIPRREREAKYQAWQVIHTAHGQKVSGARISALEDLQEQGESLAGLTLEEGANLNDINLSGADLSGADLSKADLSGAILSDADLRDTKLIGSKLIGSKLIGANLRYAKLEDADLTGADLRGADLIRADLRGAKLGVAILIRTNLSGSNLSKANLSEANLSEANLIRTDLSGADLIRADLRGADLSGADLSGADLSGAKLGGADLSSTNLSSANFRGAYLRNVIFDKADIHKTIFDRGSGLTEDRERDLEERGAIFEVPIMPIDPPLSP